MVIDFKKVISWLKKNKINYTIEESSMYTTVKLFRGATGSVELIFNPSMFVAQSLPRCARPSHAAEGSDFYVKVGDWGKWINEFIAWAKDRGYYEYNHYHCAQWGTWKFGNFISMSFFGAFIKKIITLKNGVNESMQLDEARKTLRDAGYETKKSSTLTKKQFEKDARRILAKLVGEIIDMTGEGMSQAIPGGIDVDEIWEGFGGKETVIDLFANNENGPLEDYVEKLWELSNKLKD